MTDVNKMLELADYLDAQRGYLSDPAQMYKLSKWAKMLRSSDVAATAPVAWRYRNRNSKHWIVTLDKPSDASPYVDHDAEIEPLYNAAPQAALIQKIEAEARRYADMYPISSDGRNTFNIFADWIANRLPEAPETLGDALATIPADLNWLIGKGKTRPDEPPFGVQLLCGLKIVAETEGDDLSKAIKEAVSLALSRPVLESPGSEPSSQNGNSQ